MRVRYLLAVAFDSNRHHFSVERFLLHILISPPACSSLTSQMRRGGRAQLFPCFVLFVFATSCGRCLYVCGLLNRDPRCVLDPECSRKFSSSQQQLTSRLKDEVQMYRAELDKLLADKTSLLTLTGSDVSSHKLLFIITGKLNLAL